MGGHSAFMAAQEVKVKCVLLLDPDWCAIEDASLADISTEVSNFPLCILHGKSDLNNPMYKGLKDRLKAIFSRNTN